MTGANFEEGLHKVAGGVFAYLQPDGSWGLNNAGLVADGEASLVVDSLYDLARTRRMRDAMEAAHPAARRVDWLINTHANGDHCFGNQVFAEARIVASRACAEEFSREADPQMMRNLLAAAPEMGAAGAYLRRCFGCFDFAGIEPRPPTRTFEGRMEIAVGWKTVVLIEAGPCHSRGDILVHLPGERVLFAGDLLFIGGTPIMWAGPVENWIQACERMLEMEVETFVPGHGPLTGKTGVRQMRDYWLYLREEARRCFDQGMSVFDAACELIRGPYSHWQDPERVVINIDALYRQFAGDTAGPDRMALFRMMAELAG